MRRWWRRWNTTDHPPARCSVHLSAITDPNCAGPVEAVEAKNAALALEKISEYYEKSLRWGDYNAATATKRTQARQAEFKAAIDQMIGKK